MGMDINVHDQWAVESMGAVQDRTKEHLGATDVGIIRYRKLLRRAIDQLAKQDEDALPMRGPTAAKALTGPFANDTIADSSDWRAASTRADLSRREQCPWDASIDTDN